MAGKKKERPVSLSEAVKVSEENLGKAVLNSVTADACVPWDYTNTNRQDYRCAAWSECGGQAQTPIDITGAVKHKALTAIDFQWKNTCTISRNNGHTIQFNTEPGSYIVSGGKRYDRLQSRHHITSEHTINGKYYPLEVQFVHRRPTASRLW